MNSLKRKTCLASVLLLAIGVLQAQEQVAKLKIRAALVDQNLNIKPIPKLALQLRRLDGPAGVQPIALSTGFDGLAELQVPAGRYQLTTRPIEFQGKAYAWDLEVRIAAPEHSLELSNDNAKIQAATSAAPGGDDLSSLFKRLEKSVVRVWSESGQGTGFIVDARGLILTNDHVVARSEYLAVQFDAEHKVPARLLTSDSGKDIAVLWSNLSVCPEAVVASIGASAKEPLRVVAGEKVFTIGHPLRGEKTLTSGIISKIEPEELTSDININPGSSGGPLMNSGGSVIGITTYRVQPQGGAGISGIVRIEGALPVLEEARKKMAGTQPPPSILLPVEPKDKFPAEPLKALLKLSDMDTKPYSFEVGPFRVGIYTPVVSYYEAHEDRMQAARREAKRSQSQEPETAAMAEAAKDAADYEALIVIWAGPKVSRWTGTRFKTDFRRMKLLCGDKVIEPIHPGRFPRYLRSIRGDMMDRTYQGLYRYPADAASPTCGQLSLEIYSEKDPSQPFTKILDPFMVRRVWSDFEPYRKVRESSTANPPAVPK